MKNPSFEDLVSNSLVLEAIAKLGFTEPSPVQAAAIKPAISGKDLIIQAKTGSGKTLAFAIPLLSTLYEKLGSDIPNSPFAMIISPTRELALQIADVITSISDIEPVRIIGGADMEKQVKALKKDPRIVVGTPGRILDLIKQKKLNLQKCRYFVLDEADEMLSMGFLPDVRAILTRLPDKRQGLFVSATISPRVDMLANSFLTKAEQIITETPDSEMPDVEHFYCEVGNNIMSKPAALSDFIETWRPNSAIIFCNTKSDTELVESVLRRRGFDARRINSDLNQSQRTRIMKKIRAGELQFLIATDIAARGLDIEQIDLVVNFSIHEQPESYVHRTGRTGRAGRSGRAVSLVGPRDFGSFHFLNKVLDIEFKKIDLPTEEEVAEARLAHLYEIIRVSSLEVKDRDLLVSRKLIQDLGAIAEPPEALIEMCAKLSRFSIEHHIRSEAESLEEEIDSSSEEGKEEKKARSKDRDKDRDRGKTRDKRDSKDKREKRERKPRDKKDIEDIQRVYVGQGHEQGMNDETFLTLVTDKAGLDKKDIQNLSFRDHYGFVDIGSKNAKKLIDSLNGIDYKGAELAVEKATSMKPRR